MAKGKVLLQSYNLDYSNIILRLCCILASMQNIEVDLAVILLRTTDPTGFLIL